MSELKVYGWTGWRSGLKPTPQTREIVAAHSVAEVLRIVGPRDVSRPEIVETGNNLEVLVAMSRPGTVFYRQLDQRPPVFRASAIEQVRE